MSAYQTIISKSESRLTSADFASVPMNIDFQPPKKVLARSVADWHQYIPYKPAQIHDLLSSGYDQPVKISADLTKGGLVTFNVDSSAYGLLSLVQLRLIPNVKVTDTDISVAGSSQSKGVGKNWLRNAIELALLMGAKSFEFLATNENGAFTWARLGAYLDMKHHNFQRAQANSVVHYTGRLEAVRNNLKPAIYHEAKALCRMLAPDDLVKLTKKFENVMLPLSWAPDTELAEKSKFYEPLHDFYRDHPIYAMRSQGIAYGEIRHIARCFAHAAQQGKAGLSLPRYLLSQSYWPGVIDFDNEAQMREVGKNLGGWKRIRPVDARPDVSHEMILA